MTKEQIALAKRAVACRGWRLMSGMRTHEGQVIDCVDFETGQAYSGEWDVVIGALPDLTDPATVGCLLALVREARQSPRTHVLYIEGLERWECADREQVHSCGVTEAEALVVALEEAQ